MSSYWQQTEKLTVAATGGTATFTLKYNCPIDRLTIWAISGARSLVNATFQIQINGENFNAPTAIASRKAYDLIFSSGGAFAEDIMLPCPPQRLITAGLADPFVISVLITNNDPAAAIAVTIDAAAIVHQG